MTIRAARWGDRGEAVLHGPSVVGGNATTLSRALKRIGTPSICVAYEDHRFSYGPDVVLWPDHTSLLRRELIRILAVFRTALGYRVIHFNFGTTMAMPSFPVRRASVPLITFLAREVHYRYTDALQIVEVWLLKLLRRRVVITFQGDDARQGDRSLGLFKESIAQHVDESYYNRRTDKIKRRRIGRMRRLTPDLFYVNPDLAHFLPCEARFVPYSHTEVHGLPVRTVLSTRDRVRIVHAPSHRGAKGTEAIVQTVLDLQESGYPVDLELIEHIPHKAVGDRLLSADLLVDQLYAGWYGGVAVEAMCRGVPVISYLRRDDFKVIHPDMADMLPVISADESDLRERLVEFMQLGDDARENLGVRSQSFAQRWHDPDGIASQFARFYFEDSAD